MIKLSNQHKKKLKELEGTLDKVAQRKNLSEAKRIVREIQILLRPLGHETRLMISKSKMFEIAIEKDNLDFAIPGLIGVRKKLNKRTRAYLEASVLLAVAYIRSIQLEKAKPIISEVLQNDIIIKSEKRRIEFRKAAIEKFNTESLITGISKLGKDELNIEEITKKAVSLSQKSDDEIVLEIGKAVPKQTKEFVYLIHNFSTKQLRSGERLLLPAAKEVVKSENIGNTVISSMKKVVYTSLCESNSKIHQDWLQNSFSVVSDKKYISSAIITSLAGFGIGIKALAISLTAFILKLGIEVYCDRFKPKTLMEIRSTKKNKYQIKARGDLLELVSRNRIDKTLLELDNINKSKFKNPPKEFIMIKAQWAEIKKEINLGIISAEQKYLKLNQIRSSLVDLINDLHKRN